MFGRKVTTQQFKPPIRVSCNFINPVDPDKLNGIRLGIPQWPMPLNYQDVDLMVRYSMNITPEGSQEDPNTGKSSKLTYQVPDTMRKKK